VAAEPAASPPAPAFGDATTALTAYLVLLLAIPSVLRLSALGGVGYPAAMLAFPLGLWWCWASLRGLNLPDPPVRPARGEATPGTLGGLRDRVAAAGYVYEETAIPGCQPDTGQGTLGYTDPQHKRIAVDKHSARPRRHRRSPTSSATCIAATSTGTSRTTAATGAGWRLRPR
jgi:hypothetical protein